ncbi:MAG TPA: hypothetical protein VI306_22865 [Pyrinomonadaceae bacterium]
MNSDGKTFSSNQFLRGGVSKRYKATKEQIEQNYREKLIQRERDERAQREVDERSRAESAD